MTFTGKRRAGLGGIAEMKQILFILGLCVLLSGCSGLQHHRVPESSSYEHEKVPLAVSEVMAKEAAERLARLYPPGRTALFLNKPAARAESRRPEKSIYAAPAPRSGATGKKELQARQPPASGLVPAQPAPRDFTSAFESSLRQYGFRIVSAPGNQGARVSWTIDRLATEPHAPESWYLRLVISDSEAQRLLSRVYDSAGVATGGLAEGVLE